MTLEELLARRPYSISSGASTILQQQEAVRNSTNQNTNREVHNTSSRIPATNINRPNVVFTNPTEPQGDFARSMSQITYDPSSTVQGSLSETNNLNEKLFNQIQLALAVKMGLNGPQQVKEQALHNVLTSKSARGDMEQVLQSSAEIYGDLLKPKDFKSKADLGSKAKTLQEKNQARAMLAGAPLLLAQLGALEYRKKMMMGDSDVLQNIRLGTRLSAAEFIKRLSRAAPLAVLRLFHGHLKYDFSDQMLQHAEDLDFVQDVLTASGNTIQLNPILNGVLAGFNRRRRHSRFKYGNQSLELDRLRFAQTASERDSDLYATVVESSRTKSKRTYKSTQHETGFKSSGAICRFFQKTQGCWRNKCSYSHRCVICNKTGHGAVNCFGRQKLKEEDNLPREEPTRSQERPPKPRTRRARAR